MSCELNGQILREGENLTLRGDAVPSSADVVFVVSHKDCNEDIVSRVADISTQIERNFQQAGVTDIQYGLVGYGGQNVLSEPHSHTLDSQLMESKARLVDALNSFITMEGSSEDAFSALHFAAKYPFRVGSSKAIILLPCDSCHERVTSYSQIQNFLQSRGIHLHVLMQHDFRLRTQSPKTSFIFGVDRAGLFTPKHVGDSDLVGDAELRRQVALPKDLCAAMSDTTDGSTFNVGQLLHTRPAMQKRFLDVMSRVVVKKGTDEACQNCECVADDLGLGTTICRRCDTEPTTRVSKAF